LKKKIEIDKCKLFRRNCKIWRSVIIKNYVILEYFGYNNIASQEQVIASLRKEIGGKAILLIESTHFVNKAILCSGNSDVNMSVKKC
jgi:hypothetical protein